MADRLAVEDVRAFVHDGLAAFAAPAGPEGGVAQTRWQATRERVGEAMDRLPFPISVLAQDLALSPSGLFLVALAGEVEASRACADMVARLERDGAARPSVELAERLVSTLFCERLAPLDLFAHRAVTAGVLALERDGPAPFARLSLAAELWSILSGGAAAWAGVEPLAPADPALLPAGFEAVRPALSSQLRAGTVSALVIRAASEVGRIAASDLADEMGMMAVDVSTEAWGRAGALRAACRYGRWLPVVRLALGPGERYTPPPAAIAHPAIYPLGRDGGVAGERVAEVPIGPPDREARTALWRRIVPAGEAEALGRHAALDGPTIARIGENAALAAERDGSAVTRAHVVAARQGLVAERLLSLAQPVTRRVPREAIVLPPRTAERFDDLITRCEEREAVWDGLGPAAQDATLGVHAMFVGPSGTGKTLAVSHLATRLGAPLYRLDLSSVLNKYIGQTEKNLSAALDQAGDLDVVLMMDEADALFGKRTDGDGEGERFGNMLTNFLLTRIESHPGIVVLTSNAQARIDPAFTRRLHSIIEFPEPGFDERHRIWAGHLGARSPGEKALRLLASHCELAGGYIRTAVLAAAARAPMPAQGGPIPAPFLARAAVSEYEKLGRTVPAGLKEMVG